MADNTLLTLSKMGYARYRPKLRENATGINLPTGFTAHTDATSNLLVNFTITYEWTSSINCKISEIAWKPGKIVLNSENVREIVDAEFAGNSPFIAAGKAEVKIGGSTLENLTNISANACTLNDLNLNYSVNQQYLLCDFTYSNVIDVTDENGNDNDANGVLYSQIEYYIEIKNIKIPKTTKYEHNVVFTQDGLTEFITNIKRYPVINIEEVSPTEWINVSNGQPSIKVTHGNPNFGGLSQPYKYIKVGSNIKFLNFNSNNLDNLTDEDYIIKLSKDNQVWPNQETGTFRVNINNEIFEIPIKGLAGGSGQLNIGGDLLPSKDNKYNIGSPSLIDYIEVSQYDSSINPYYKFGLYHPTEYDEELTYYIKLDPYDVYTRVKQNDVYDSNITYYTPNENSSIMSMAPNASNNFNFPGEDNIYCFDTYERVTDNNFPNENSTVSNTYIGYIDGIKATWYDEHETYYIKTIEPSKAFPLPNYFRTHFSAFYNSKMHVYQFNGPMAMGLYFENANDQPEDWENGEYYLEGPVYTIANPQPTSEQIQQGDYYIISDIATYSYEGYEIINEGTETEKGLPIWTAYPVNVNENDLSKLQFNLTKDTTQYYINKYYLDSPQPTNSLYPTDTKYYSQYESYIQANPSPDSTNFNNGHYATKETITDDYRQVNPSDINQNNIQNYYVYGYYEAQPQPTNNEDFNNNTYYKKVGTKLRWKNLSLSGDIILSDNNNHSFNLKGGETYQFLRGNGTDNIPVWSNTLIKNGNTALPALMIANGAIAKGAENPNDEDANGDKKEFYYGGIYFGGSNIGAQKEDSLVRLLSYNATDHLNGDRTKFSIAVMQNAVNSENNAELQIAYDNTTGKTFNNTNFASHQKRCQFNGAFSADKVFNAVFNDYAEYRTTINLTPGHVVIDNDDGSLSCSSQRLQPGAQVISDTFGHSMGETDTAKTPLAVAGRVLVYTYQPRENYHAGMAVCSAPNGTVDIMTREEIRDYPDCIVGIVSEIPQYETWGSDNIKVDGRIWIKVK